MAGPTVEEQVVLDADGRALFAAMSAIEQRLRTIKSEVNLINDAAAKGAKTFDAVLNQTAKNLQRTMSGMRTLAQSNNAPSGRVLDLTANRALGLQTRQAIEYARELNVARNSVEALTARINKLNQAAAAQGTVTTKQRDQIANYEKTLGVLKQLDRQYDQLLNKSRRVGSVDLSGELSAINAARDRFQNATQSGRRVNFTTELNGITDAQAALQERIVAARRQETQAISNSLRARRELAVADVASLRGAEALEAARVANARQLTMLRGQLRSASAAEMRPIIESLEIEKARGRQIQINIRAIEAEAAARSRANAQQASAMERQAAAAERNSLGARAGRAAGNTALYGGVAMVGFAALGAVQSGASEVIQMEDELAKLAAISDSTTTQMQSLKTSIFDVAATSRYSTVELIKISQTLAQAGISAGQMTDVLKSVTTLANASGSTPDEAANLVTSAMGSFQLQATEAARVADLMTSALNRTRLTVAQVGQAIQYVGATAYEQNITLEQLLATVGAISQAGVKSGSTIGTGFRQFLVDLQTPSAKLTEQFDKLGIKQKDVDVSTRGLTAVFETLTKAGFGSAQAYQGLETRAAAFYLTAKNNLDIMADLQISFAQQDAAARANERAMGSLTSQWQRFKNIIVDGIAESSESSLNDLRDWLRQISDSLQRTEDEVNARRERIRNGQSNGGFSDTVEKYLGAGATRTYLNYLSPPDPWDTQKKGLGDLLVAQDNVRKSAKDMATTMAETSEKISTQSGVISELEKEYTRLLTQKDSLQGNDKQSSAEMVSLMSRFEGLAGHLTNTKNLYVDLTNAVSGFIAENQRALAGTLAVQQANLASQNADLRGARGSILGQIRANPMSGRLDAATKSAIEAVRANAPGTDASNRGLVVIADAATKLAGSDLGKNLLDLASNVRTASGNVAQFGAATSQRNAASAAGTDVGQNITNRQAKIDALIARGGSDPGVLKEARALVAEGRKYIQSFSARPEHQRFVQGARDSLDSSANQIRALLTPSAADTKAAAAADRAATTAAAKVKQSDIDALGKALGLQLGSGTRSAAEQDALHARGVTRATSRTSGHVVGVARDFRTGSVSEEEGRRLEEAARKYYADQGITGLHIKYESGRGKNNGSGPHLHVNAKPGASVSGARGGDDQGFAAQAELAQAQTQISQRTFNTALRNLRAGGSEALFETTVAAAREAQDKLAEGLRADAKNDLAKIGIVNEADPRYQERMGQIEDAIAQNVEQLQQAIVGGLIAGIDKQFKAIATAAALAMKPFDDNLATAQGAVSGLGLFSNRFAPSYVTSLAQNRSARAQETQLRAQAATLPGQIDSQQAGLDAFTARVNSGEFSGPALEAAQQKVQELTKAVADLRTQKAGLDAQLAAGGLIPTNFNDGIQQAIQAYQEANNLGVSFKEDVMNNLGGVVDNLGSGITTFFTDIVSGSKSALGAFGGFAKGMLNYINQLAAQMVAKQVLGFLFNLAGSAFGGTKTAAGSSIQVGGEVGSFFGRFNGGPITGYDSGGRVVNGSDGYDSVNAKLAKGEWVINKKAVDSVGNDFMAELNKNGAGALEGTKSIPIIAPQAPQETNVWVVKPDQQPVPGPRDFVVAIAEDILAGGETKKLIKHVQNGG